MTPEDYDLVKSLAEIIVSALAGGTIGVYIQNRFDIVNVITTHKSKLVDKSKHEVNVNNSPGASVNIDSGPKIGTQEDALGSPIQTPLSPALTGDSQFMVKEIKIIFDRNRLRIRNEEDYSQAEQHRIQGNKKAAATLYARFFGQIAAVLKQDGDTTAADALQEELKQFAAVSVGNPSADSLDDIVRGVEAIIFKSFQQIK